MNMKKTGKGVYLFLFGVLFAGIDIMISTGIDYGFQFGVQEGVSKGMNTYFLEALIGERFRLDVLFNPAGYLLMLLGLAGMNGYRKYMRNMRVFAVVGCVADIIRIALPFLLNQYDILLPLLIFTGIEILCLIIIMYSFTLACKKQVDNFQYMEVGKDLTFATELYGFAVVASYITLPFAALYMYFARGAYLLTVLLTWAGILYFVFSAVRYTRKLNLFANKEHMGEGIEN